MHLHNNGAYDLDRCWEILWLLKNSLTRNLQKLDRVRKLYKRFFSVSWTFSITRFLTFFRKTDFFNSHTSSHHLSQREIGSDNPCSRHLSRSRRKRAKDNNFLTAPSLLAVLPSTFAQCLIPRIRIDLAPLRVEAAIRLEMIYDRIIEISTSGVGKVTYGL